LYFTTQTGHDDSEVIGIVIQVDEFQTSFYNSLCLLRALSDAIGDGVFHDAKMVPLIALSGLAVTSMSQIERIVRTTDFLPYVFSLGSFDRDQRLQLVFSCLQFAYERDGRSADELQARENELLASSLFLPLVAFAGVLPKSAEFLVEALEICPLQTTEQALQVSLLCFRLHVSSC
jgi:hypothetical protein